MVASAIWQIMVLRDVMAQATIQELICTIMMVNSKTRYVQHFRMRVLKLMHIIIQIYTCISITLGTMVYTESFGNEAFQPNCLEDMGRSSRHSRSRGNFSKMAMLPRRVSLEPRELPTSSVGVL